MVCKVCGKEMLLDHVKQNKFYYACVNPNCKERGKAYTKEGSEAVSTIKNKE